MLGQLAGVAEADGGLDFAAGDNEPFIDARELGGLDCNLLEGVVHEGVHGTCNEMQQRRQVEVKVAVDTEANAEAATAADAGDPCTSSYCGVRQQWLASFV